MVSWGSRAGQPVRWSRALRVPGVTSGVPLETLAKTPGGEQFDGHVQQRVYRLHLDASQKVEVIPSVAQANLDGKGRPVTGFRDLPSDRAAGIAERIAKEIDLLPELPLDGVASGEGDLEL